MLLKQTEQIRRVITDLEEKGQKISDSEFEHIIQQLDGRCDLSDLKYWTDEDIKTAILELQKQKQKEK